MDKARDDKRRFDRELEEYQKKLKLFQQNPHWSIKKTTGNANNSTGGGEVEEVAPPPPVQKRVRTLVVGLQLFIYHRQNSSASQVRCRSIQNVKLVEENLANLYRVQRAASTFLTSCCCLAFAFSYSLSGVFIHLVFNYSQMPKRKLEHFQFGSALYVLRNPVSLFLHFSERIAKCVRSAMTLATRTS